MGFMLSIERGEVSLKAKEPWSEVYAGNVEYEASNGWKLAIFNDCDEWDYIDQITTADGRQINYDEIYGTELDSYCPDAKTQKEVYGIS